MRVAKNAVGLLIKVTVKEDSAAVDISAASTKQIKLRSPAGVVKSKTATFFTNGSDGIITYTTIASDLDEEGVWDISAYIVLSGGFDGQTFIDNFVVQPIIV